MINAVENTLLSMGIERDDVETLTVICSLSIGVMVFAAPAFAFLTYIFF